MASYREYGAKDEVPELDGDIQWKGVDMREQVAPGFAKEAVNCRFEEGKIRPRKGSAKLPWTNKVAATVGGGTGFQPWGTVYGRGEFKDAENRAWQVWAADGNVYASTANNGTQQLNLPTGVSLTSSVEFVQAKDTLVCCRGLELVPLVMTSIDDGFIERPHTPLATETKTISVNSGTDEVTISNQDGAHNLETGQAATVLNDDEDGELPGGLSEGVTYYARVIDANKVTLHTTSDGAVADTGRVDITSSGVGVNEIQYENRLIHLASSMPNCIRGIWTANRLWLQTVNDGVWASDIAGIYTYTLQNQKAVNQGSVDPLVTIALFGKEIIALKRRSIFRMTNIAGNLSDLQVVSVTRRYGCAAAKSVVDVGTDLLWLTDDGIASLTLTELGEIQTAEGVTGKPPMFSDPIEPLMQRIKWQYAGNAVGAFWNRRYYLAVPLDDAESFRQNLTGGTYVGGFTRQVFPTGEYYWTRGPNELSLTVQGAETVTLTNNGYFTATPDDLVRLETSLSTDEEVTATIRRVYRRVNTAILVYDFRNQAWSGHDEAEGVEVKEFFITRLLEKDRLFLVGADGWVTLYEQTFEDQLSEPYTDVTVTAAPAELQSIRVNGAASATITNLNDVNQLGLSLYWGIGAVPSIEVAARNLWRDEGGAGGYSGEGPWSAPNTTPVPIEGGVRFYATNGLIPVVELIPAAFLQVQPVNMQPVRQRVRLRPYRTPGGLMTALKRIAAMVLHVRTWSPRYTVRLKTEGVEETRLLVDEQTRDRTVFDRPYDAPPYDTTNADDNFLEPHRQDYSVKFDNVLPLHEIDIGSGIKVDVHQEVAHKLRGGSARGWSPMIEIENTNGRLELLAAGIEGFEASRRKGVVS